MERSTEEQMRFHFIKARKAEDYEQRTYSDQFQERHRISDETRRLYEGHDKTHDGDPDYGRLSPDQWATAMRRGLG